MARVASPHIVRVMALRETEHGMFIVMEYVDGGSLHDRMADGPMPWATLWPLLRQMLLGLEAAHTVGVVHRDIKPRNVLLTTDDTVKLTDFGLARLQSDGDATRTQAVAGTLAYMSPEQVRSLPTLDHRSDLFSLGLTAYEALVGRLPFDRDGGDFTMMRAIVEDEVPAPTTFDDRVPPEVATALMRALEKDPDRRYSSAAEMREALAGVEVLWRDELQPYLAALDSNEIVEAIATEGNRPFEPPLTQEGPLRSARSATVLLTVATNDLPDPSRWLREWQQLEGFADASIDSIALDGEDGYLTIVTLNLSSAVLTEQEASE